VDFMRTFAIYLERPLNNARLRDQQQTFGMYRELR
jgi:hypothetical protein